MCRMAIPWYRPALVLGCWQSGRNNLPRCQSQPLPSIGDSKPLAPKPSLQHALSLQASWGLFWILTPFSWRPLSPALPPTHGLHSDPNHWDLPGAREPWTAHSPTSITSNFLTQKSLYLPLWEKSERIRVQIPLVPTPFPPALLNRNKQYIWIELLSSHLFRQILLKVKSPAWAAIHGDTSVALIKRRKFPKACPTNSASVSWIQSTFH